MAANATPGGVTPRKGEGALGTMIAHEDDTVGDSVLSMAVNGASGYLYGKPILLGVYVNVHLSFNILGKAIRGETAQSSAANRTREIRPSGMRGGLAET